uniref:Cadherin domain-containing protein n=1 Tax=Capra hircus TaxID=9925 RepID=A0A8C2P1H4_CAPHI
MEMMQMKLHQNKRQVMIFITLILSWEAGSESIRYSVLEETESGTFVANLTKDLGLRMGELAARGARVVFKGNRQHLRLDPDTCDLLLNDKLDREELCGSTEPCVLPFQVLLENPFQLFQAALVIRDVNDHAPEFPAREMQLKISEITIPGKVFPLKMAQDLDAGSNGLQSYIISSNPHFHILTRNRKDGRKSPELVLDKALDREEHPELRLTLTALDGGSPPRSGTTEIQILVLDSNDNAPEFAQEFYEAEIPENSSLGSLVITVSARDLDAGSFGEVSYALFQVDDVNEPFEINANTGEIRLKKKLDFEEFQSYQVDIEATDGGGLSGKCSVVIKVLDVNDNAPQLTMSSLTSPIPENLPEILVAVFSVSDADSGHNQQVICSIHDNLPFVLRPSVENFYTLVTEGALDREQRAEYNITITLLMEKPFEIFGAKLWVRDINDHSPVFLDREIPLKILESTTPGAAFLLQSAQDSDIGTNNVRNYTISPNAYFHISVHNGAEGIIYPELVLDRPLDREEVPELSLILTALDGGSPVRSGTTLVRILVWDTNDNAPEFVQPLYKVQLCEDSPVGSLVVTVSARDLDTGIYAFFYATEKILKTFQINPTSGSVYLRAELNYEVMQTYTLTIQAKDGGGLSGKCTVVVQVTDINDNPPELLMSSLTSPIQENSLETVVAVFRIRDRDSGNNAKMVCSIQDDLPFILKPSVENYYTLVTDSPLDREERAEYNITITSYQYEVCLMGGYGTGDIGREVEEYPSYRNDLGL